MRTSSLNLLLSCASPSWGGLEMLIPQLAREMRHRGHRVRVAGIPDSTLARTVEGENFPLVPISPRHPLRSILTLSRALASDPPDLVHTMLSKDLWVLVPALRRTSSPAPLLLSKQMGSGVVKKDLLHRWLYQRTTRLVAISSYIERNLLDTCPVTADRIEKIPNGIPVDTYSRQDWNAEDIRAELGIPRQALVVGCTGRFSIGKGQWELVRAFARLASELPSLHLLLVGGPSFGEEDYERKVRAEVDNAGLTARVTFAGFRDDVPRLLAAMDIYAFPSYDEAFGMALVEAMAMELPVIASNSGGVPDIAIANETALLVPPREVDPLAEALSLLARDETLRQRLGKGGRQRAPLFDLTLMFDRYETLYHRLVDTTHSSS